MTIDEIESIDSISIKFAKTHNNSYLKCPQNAPSRNNVKSFPISFQTIFNLFAFSPFEM